MGDSQMPKDIGTFDLPSSRLVHEPLRACASAEEFIKQLLQFDQELAKERQEAEDAGEVSFL
ncbi:hypothetical protein Patl1_07718 [Pistacia atlantica]|uniref:Uncharacterized protein n=1 Tax=Pistacia atlantica TaxID=434234 RepID=A0ACC1ALN8_9ROSI|nr:hypothetical protein Patl1_07718 [Pistacia atlantica]